MAWFLQVLSQNSHVSHYTRETHTTGLHLYLLFILILLRGLLHIGSTAPGPWAHHTTPCLPQPVTMSPHRPTTSSRCLGLWSEGEPWLCPRRGTDELDTALKGNSELSQPPAATKSPPAPSQPYTAGTTLQAPTTTPPEAQASHVEAQGSWNGCWLPRILSTSENQDSYLGD